MRKRILIVEDTDDNRRILCDLLSNAGYDLAEALDGEHGVEMARRFRPDLILMDVQLPKVDGYEATQRIRAQPGLGDVPIIAVTSYAMSGEEAKALAVGCTAYVSKPFSPRKILAKIQELLP